MADAEAADRARDRAASSKVKPAWSCSRIVARGAQSGAAACVRVVWPLVPERVRLLTSGGVRPLRRRHAWRVASSAAALGRTPAAAGASSDARPSCRAGSVVLPARADPRAAAAPAVSGFAATKASRRIHDAARRIGRRRSAFRHAVSNEALPQRVAIALALGRRFRRGDVRAQPFAFGARRDVGAVPPAGDGGKVVRRRHRHGSRGPSAPAA